MNKAPIKLHFYTKPDCQLCDEAKSVLQEIKKKLPFIVIEDIDITENLRLFTQYKYLIPVLEMDSKRLFVGKVNRNKLIRQLRWYQFCKGFQKLNKC